MKEFWAVEISRKGYNEPDFVEFTIKDYTEVLEYYILWCRRIGTCSPMVTQVRLLWRSKTQGWTQEDCTCM